MRAFVAVCVLSLTGCGLVLDIGPPDPPFDAAAPRRDGGEGDTDASCERCADARVCDAGCPDER